MKTLTAAAVILLTVAGSASAQCIQNTHLADIPYEKNSSYFQNASAKKLDLLIEEVTKSTGYLVLEFQLLKEQENEDARKYNMWLAHRRIDRVKQYLTDANFSAPIISKILTASSEDRRDVSINWCELNNSESTVAVANHTAEKE